MVGSRREYGRAATRGLRHPRATLGRILVGANGVRPPRPKRCFVDIEAELWRASDLHYTAQADTDEDGRSCVKVHGSLLLPFKQPETDVLSVQCSIGEDVQLLSFYLYDGE